MNKKKYRNQTKFSIFLLNKVRVWYLQTDWHAIHIRFCFSQIISTLKCVKMVDFERIVCIVSYEICRFGCDIQILHMEWQRVKRLSLGCTVYSHLSLSGHEIRFCIWKCMIKKKIECEWKCDASEWQAFFLIYIHLHPIKLNFFLCLWFIKCSVNKNLSSYFKNNVFLIVIIFDDFRRRFVKFWFFQPGNNSPTHSILLSKAYLINLKIQFQEEFRMVFITTKLVDFDSHPCVFC